MGFHAIVEEYAQDNDLFLEDFRKAWVKLVNADRFGDVCVTSVTTTTTSSPSTMKPGASMPDGNMQIVEPASGPVTVNCNSEPGKKRSFHCGLDVHHGFGPDGFCADCPGLHACTRYVD